MTHPAPLASANLSPRADVLARIAAAARSAGRDRSDTALVAVSKQQPWSRIRSVLDDGQRIFGENRVQEALDRWREVRAELADLELRLIGPLQSNKALDAVTHFDVIEVLDRPKLARAITDAMSSTGRTPRLYVQVNTGEEPQKSGVRPDALDAFLLALRRDFGLTAEGLMCIPPAAEPAGLHFALLAKLAARNGLERLSMGMSADFETAVRFGATSVRVGSALFGARAADAPAL